jgi:predicted short-subunit dehydrogenase-like oxidoreductase (DUF2520 family)
MVTLAGDGVSSILRPSPPGTDLLFHYFFLSTDRYLRLRELERVSSSNDRARPEVGGARPNAGARVADRARAGADVRVADRARAGADAQPRQDRELRLAIVGDGRLGRAFADGFRSAGYQVDGPLGRGASAADADAVLLCVPDAEIAEAAGHIAAGRLVGHCSGATDLQPLHPHEAFSLHPLMTVTREGADFSRAGAAIAGATPRAVAVARRLASALGLRAVEVSAEDRPAYHAAASIASNFLVTLEAAAERLAETVGIERALLVPLVRATVENWARLGPSEALTGPVARRDQRTVEAQRVAVASRAPELLSLFDALVEATQKLADVRQGVPV